MDLHRRLLHPHVLRMYAAFVEKGFLVLVQEYAQVRGAGAVATLYATRTFAVRCAGGRFGIPDHRPGKRSCTGIWAP